MVRLSIITYKSGGIGNGVYTRYSQVGSDMFLFVLMKSVWHLLRLKQAAQEHLHMYMYVPWPAAPRIDISIRNP